MDKNAPVEIRKTMNGYMVNRAHSPFSDEGPRSLSETFVFIDKGPLEGRSDGKTLLGWLDEHFT